MGTVHWETSDKIKQLIRDKMIISKEKQSEHISQIRRILVIKPDASVREVKEALATQRKPLKLDKDYINKLVNKIRKERAKRLDYYTVNKVLAEFQDEVEELKKRLWLIITSVESSERDKVAAIRELRTSSKDLFDKMFDAGVFSRKLGELEVKTLSDKDTALIKKSIDYARGTNRKDIERPDISQSTGD